MNYYTIYEKLLISLYFLCHLFFFLFCCKNKKYFSFMQIFGLFLLCFHEKRLILRLYPGCYPGLGASGPSGRVWVRYLKYRCTDLAEPVEFLAAHFCYG